MKRTSVVTDMTAMCDVAFLLLTFFILTSTFKPDEQVVVDLPSSMSKKELADKNMFVIIVAEDSTVHIKMDNPLYAQALVQKMADKKGIKTLSGNDIASFGYLPSYGLPINQMSAFLKMDPKQQRNVKLTGVPVDSTNNELVDWLITATEVYQEQGVKDWKKKYIAVKGDMNAQYKHAKVVIDALKEVNLTHVNIITDLEK